MTRKGLLHVSYRLARQIVVGLVGATVCLVGVVLIFTPGPALIVIPAGLAILSLEFAFARRWLHSLRQRISKTMQGQAGKRVDRYK